MPYKTNLFRYKNKNDFGVEVFARDEETANKIVLIWNCIVPAKNRWKPKRIGFKKPVTIEVPPYEAEESQRQWFEHIKEEYCRNEGRKPIGMIVYEEEQARQKEAQN